MIEGGGQKSVPAVQNAVTIMRLLASSGQSLGATQIARETGMNVSSAFNILRTLTQERLLSFDSDSKTYRIGMGLMEFAAPLLPANPADLIRPAIDAIAREHRVAIAIWHIAANARIVLIDRVSAPNIVQAAIAPNTRMPAFSGAIGRLYAAALGLGKVETRKGYESVRWQNPPGFESYWSDVQAARETGVARDRRQLFHGLDIVATLLRDASDAPRIGLSSITIAGQQTDETLAKVGVALADAARHIERSVFGRRPAP